MKPRFKVKEYDQFFQTLVNNTPEQISDRKIWGSILALFTMGYNGQPLPHYVCRNSFTYIAYVAGKESNKNTNRSVLK